MKTMKMLVRGLLATTLFACGGGMDTTSVGAGEEGTTEEATSNPMSPDAIVAEVQWKGEAIQFINTAEEGQEPAILLSRVGDPADGDLLTLFQQQAKYTVSPAELWRAATKSENIPEVLLEDHQNMVAETGRPVDLQTFSEGSVEKASFSFPAMFPLTNKPVGTCWGQGVILGEGVGDFNPGYLCSAVNPGSMGQQLWHSAPISNSNACPSSLNTKEPIRAGLFNGPPAVLGPTNNNPTLIGLVCFDGGSSGWTCGAGNAVLKNQYWVTEYAKTSFTHRFAIGFSGNGGGNAIITAAAAHLVNGITSFGGSDCGDLRQ